MRKILIALMILFLAFPALAQEKGDNGEGDKHKAYTIVGLFSGFNYFYNVEDSSKSMGLFAKFPIGGEFGLEASLNNYTIPVTSYTYGTNSYSGFGEENYTQISAAFLYYLPVLERSLQVKLGVDYYDFQGGHIIADPGASAGVIGTDYQMSSSGMASLLGVHVGVNLDVPIYEKIDLTSSLNVHYIANHSESVPVELRLGIGYHI